jgi:hypothetical protein
MCFGLDDMSQQRLEGNKTAFREGEASNTVNFIIHGTSFCSISIADVFITGLHINFILKINLNAS